jgi:hypothetical protein
MTLAADWIAANVLPANPELRDALYRKYFGVSEEWLSSQGAAEAAKALDREQVARRLNAISIANLHETTTHEERRA